MRGAFIILFLLSLLLSSCNQKSFDSKKELLGYIKNPENGYFQTKKVNGLQISLTYRPTDLLVKQDLGTSAISKKTIDSLRAKYNKYIYFNLRMSKNGQELLNSTSGSNGEFGAMVNQLVFDMGEKVHLFSDQKDTIELVDYIYPRMYGMSQSTSLMLIYPRIANYSENLTLSIEDIGFNTGEVKFKIKSNKIINQPQLSFEH